MSTSDQREVTDEEMIEGEQSIQVLIKKIAENKIGFQNSKDSQMVIDELTRMKDLFVRMKYWTLKTEERLQRKYNNQQYYNSGG